jgi:gliding motility-associated-like protein
MNTQATKSQIIRFSFMRILVFVLLCFAQQTFGQLVTSSQNPTSLVQNVLLGPGVTVSNIFYSGSPNAIGYFNGANTNLGIAEGIVMTTGTIAPGGTGPHGPNNSGTSGVDNNFSGYNQLSNLIGNIQTYNAAILEFDFVPYADTVRFKYVFGSEEYPEFVGSDFNDVFAFFISGPGIAGLQNIAKLPNGQTVAINNVNGGNPPTFPPINANYFVNNGTGTNAPFNASATYIQYDGFTKVLEAVSKVQCGQTYHLVIAIADALDGIYDSGIFLQANSLSSKIPVEVDYELSFDAFGDGQTMAEGCVTTDVTLTRNTGNLTIPLTIPISVTGTATTGIDYSAIPTSITFPAGQAQTSFSFSSLADGLVEGVETLNIIFQIPDPCGGNNPITLNLKINDIQPVSVSVNSSSLTCPGEPVEIIANPAGGVGPYTYLWNTGATTSSIFVNPTSTQTFTVTVTDDCLQQSATASSTITVPVFVPLAIQITPDITEICPYVAKDLSVVPTGGAGGYEYSWMDQNGMVLTTDSLITVTPSASTFYVVQVTDFCENTEIDTVFYTITSPPLVVTMNNPPDICPFQPVTIAATATGGFGQYFYLWIHSGETTSSVTVSPGVTTNYLVKVSDECQTFTVNGNITVTVIKPNADFVALSSTFFEDLPVTFQNLSTGAVSYQWDLGDGSSSSMVHPSNTYFTPDTFYITLIATNASGCIDSIKKPLIILEEYWVYIPNTFTPDEGRYNNTFWISTINIEKMNTAIFNRWGEIIFETNDVNFHWDGKYNGKVIQDGTYGYKVSYVTNSKIENTLYGHVTILK